MSKGLLYEMSKGRSSIEKAYVKLKSLLGESTLIPTFVVDIEAKFKRAPRRLLPVLPRLPAPLGYARPYPPQVVVGV